MDLYCTSYRGEIEMIQEFVQNVENVARDVMEEMHTALPGKFISYNPDTGTAEVKPYGVFRTPAGKNMEYPLLTEVPVILPQCSSLGVEIAFPIRKDDDCLLIISEQELDGWLYNEESDAELRFDLTSAIAIPGLSRKRNTAMSEACKSGSLILKCGSNKISISQNGVAISGNLTVDGNITATGIVNGSNIG